MDLLTPAYLLLGVLACLTVLRFADDAAPAQPKDFPVDINDGARTVRIKAGRSLLWGLNENGILVPTACGGRGACGVCKVTVLEGGGPVQETELPYLSEAERERQVRLSCQIRVRNPLRVRVSDQILNAKQFPATLESITDLTHDIKGLRFRLPEGMTISFRAGQYVQFQAPAYDKVKAPTWRAYSLSNAPSDNGVIELCVRLVPNGIVTGYVFNHLQVGQKLTINGPYGDFFLRTDSDREIICIAGGSGMSPIKSIVHDMLERGITHRKTRFFFGAVRLSDIYYVDHFKGLAREHDFFEFIPALSAPDDQGDGGFETGLITDVVKRHYEHANNHEAYLCGSPGMIGACIKVLTELGMPQDRIFYDKFC